MGLLLLGREEVEEDEWEGEEEGDEETPEDEWFCERDFHSI